METSLLKKRLWNGLLLIIALLFVGISYAHEIIPDRSLVHKTDLATVFTDKDDYQPGEYVIVSGSGWLPGETVQLHFDETPQVCTNDHDRFTVADANGNIYYNQFLINDRHLGVAFVLTATGQSSGYNAQTFFTDATWGLEVSTNGGSSYLNNSTNPTVAFSSCETKQITFRLTQQNNTNPNQSYTFVLPAGFSISLPSSLAFFNAANNSIIKSWSVSQYASNAICLSASSSSDALGANQKIVFTCSVTSVANVASTEITGRANNTATCLNPSGSSGVLMNITRPKFSSSADMIPPVLTPGADQDVVLGSDCKIEIPDVKGSASDNCSGVTIVQVPAAGELVSSSHNGNVVVTVTATDAAGLTDIEEVTLTAKDETSPVLTPGANQDVVLGSDCKIEIPNVLGSASDNCSGVTVVQVPAAGELVSSSHNGNVVVTVTATDVAGLTDIEEVTLTAKDESAPVLTPGANQDVVLGSDCKIEIPNVLGSASDNCSGVTIVQVPAAGELVSSSHNGNIVVTVTATDAAGLTDIEEVTLTAKDETSPVLTPGANQDVVLGSDCKIEIPDVKGSASDNCSGVTIVQVPAAGELVSSSHNGNVAVTVTATDAAGLTDIEEVTLTAKDETAPVLTPGANQDVVLGSDCKIEIPNVLGSASDNCSGVTVVQVPAAGELVSSSHNGNIVVTVTATDAAGLTDIEEVTLTAKDESAPVLTPGANQDVVLGSDCKIEIPDVKGSATDNCSGVTVVQVPAAGELVSSSHNGNIVVTVTATDAAGLTDIEEVTLTAKDETSPVLTPGANQDVVLGSDCKIEIPDVKGSASDNCSGVTVVQVPAAGELVSSSHNGNIVVTVTATDAAGLTDIEEVTLTAKDETSPVLTPGANQDVVLGSDCKIEIPDVKGSASDNCSGVTVVQVPAAGELVSSSHNGNVVVTVTVTDAAGLTDIEEVTLTAKDETSPVLTPGANQDVVLGSDCKIEIPDVKGSASDNCSGVTVVQVPAAGELVSSSHNGNIVVTVTATDAAGLTDIEEVTLTAKDETSPVLTPGANQDVVLGSDCKIEIPDVKGSASDNCSGVNIVQVPAAGELVSSSHNGNVVVTVTATDAAGLTDIEEVTLTAKDETAPSIVCPANIELSTCQSAATWSVPSASDNCSGVTVEQIAGPARGSSIANGEEVTVTYRATDGGGNVNDCSFTIKRATVLGATISSDNSVLYFGYPGNQTAIITAVPSGGTAPYTVKIQMVNGVAASIRDNGKLICNFVNASGDEVWTPGSNTNALLSTGIACASNSVPASSTSNTTYGNYSINVALLADARFIAIVTDAKGCTYTIPYEQAARVDAEDVRCFAGNSGVPKITICHQTGNSKNKCVAICVDESAVAEHLSHGDFLGKCTSTCLPVTSNSKSEMAFNVIAYPNPSNNQFTFEIESGSNDTIDIKVFDIAGRLINEMGNIKESTVTFGENLPRGVYLAVIQQGNNQKTIRIIKE